MAIYMENNSGKIKKPRILFLSPYKPYPDVPIEEDNIDYFYYRNTLYQKVYQIKQWHSWHPLHYIAQNLPVPSVVLENPSWLDFTNELKRGNYDIVAISFTIILSERVLEMVRWIKKNYPHIVVILGGYGVAVLEEKNYLSRQLLPLVDYVVAEEGLSFFENYLKNHWNVKGKVTRKQELLTSRNYFFKTNIPLFEQLNFVVKLGCRNRCVFCSTSHHFKGKTHSLLSPRELYEFLKSASRKYPQIKSAIIYDENFLAARDFVEEFSSYYSKDLELQLKPLYLTVFSSFDVVKTYSIEELYRAGIGTIFLGVESFCVSSREKFKKLQDVDIKKEVKRLHWAGINTLLSLIIGWDEENREEVAVSIKEFVKLNPTFYQVVPLHPLPGTFLWEKMKSEGRIDLSNHYWNDGVTYNSFKYKYFTQEEIHLLALKTYRKLVAEGGPWPLRMLNNLISGYFFSHSNRKKSRVFALRKIGYRKLLDELFPVAWTTLLFFPKVFFKNIKKRFHLIFKLPPEMIFISFIKAIVLAPLLIMVYFYIKLRECCLKLEDQPVTIRKEYGG